MILNVPESPHPTIHQDVYIPPSTAVSRHPFQSLFPEERRSRRQPARQLETRWIQSSIVGENRLGSLGVFGEVSIVRTDSLNMCTLLSLKRNNTRYLAREKCLSRRIPELAGAAAKLRISPEVGVSPHKGSTNCLFFLPPCLSSARWIALCHFFYSRRECCRGMTPENLYVAKSVLVVANILYRVNQSRLY